MTKHFGVKISLGVQAKLMSDPFLVIDDFLPQEDFKKIQSTLLGDDFPWYYTNTTSRPEGSYMPPGSIETQGWYHLFLSREQMIKNVTYETLQPLIKEIENQENAEFIRIRASMKTHTIGFTDQNYNLPHVDYEFPHMSIIYYIDDETDGDTWLFNEDFTGFPEPDNSTVQGRVSPKPNRLLVLNGLQYHTASNPINYNLRTIININYIKR